MYPVVMPKEERKPNSFASGSAAPLHPVAGQPIQKATDAVGGLQGWGLDDCEEGRDRGRHLAPRYPGLVPLEEL